MTAGLEHMVVVYAAVGGRMAGLATSLSAALAYTWFFTTPYETLRIDTAGQMATVPGRPGDPPATVHALANAR